MADVKIYATLFCPYCARAKQLLDAKGVAYTEIDVMFDGKRKREMVELAGGRRTVPQIFVDGRHVGGCDELFALEAAGRLDPLLQEGSAA